MRSFDFFDSFRSGRAAALFAGAALAALATPTAPLSAQTKTTFADHVLPLVEQHCAKCHNPDKKKGDLDLTSHSGALKGGGTGPVVVSGQPDASRLIKSLTHGEEPFMPPNKPPIAEKEIAVFKSWIAGGLLETSGSKAVAAAKPAVDLTLKVSSLGKPTGPPPMPMELPFEPAIHTPRGSAVNGLAASPWAPLLAVTSQKQVLCFNSTNAELLGVLPFPDGQPVDLKFSRSGQLLLAGGGHGAKAGKVTLWNVESGRRLATLGNEYDTVLAADVSPDQSKVALGGPDRLIKIHATSTGELLHKIKKHTDWVTALAFSPDGQMLASGDRNGGVTFWDADSAQELVTTAGHKSAVTALSWRSDSKLLASSSEDGSVKLWESTEGKQAKTWNAHGSGVLGVAYSHDGRFVTCGRDGTVIVWDANGNKTKTMSVAGEMATRCAWTHDDAAVVAGDFTGQITLWDAKSGQRLHQMDNNPRPLEDQIAAARRVVRELAARTNQPPAGLVAAERAAAEAGHRADATRAAAEKANADFRAKADTVARLKDTAAKPNPPPDIDAQLTAARASREAARAAHAAAAAAADAAAKDLTEAKSRVEAARKLDVTAELTAARSTLDRLERARAVSAAFHAREKAPPP